jgi:hypothetical protein
MLHGLGLWSLISNTSMTTARTFTPMTILLTGFISTIYVITCVSINSMRFSSLSAIAAVSALTSANAAPRWLPSGPLNIAYPSGGECDAKVITAVKNGLNVVIWCVRFVG